MLKTLHYFMIFCVVTGTLGQEKPIALLGIILSPKQIINNGTLLIVDGHIAAVGANVSIPNGTIILHTNGIILPGLIDLHNHLTWNIFPRWKPSEEFNNRYDWQQKPIYKILLETPHRKLVEMGLSCEMQRYAEVKAIAQGATSVIGGVRKPCNRELVRNLGDDPTLGQILYDVFPLQMTNMKFKEVDEVLSKNGTLFIHLAEGLPNDGISMREFYMLKTRNLLRPGVSIIHGVSLKDDDFRLMANTEVGLIWSPRSNLELYGHTTNLESALKNHVTISIAPDWSPTGSDGMLSELNYAATWNAGLENSLLSDQLLLKMTTVNPAKLLHFEQRLGVLKEGYIADVLVLQLTDNQSNLNPHWAVTHSTPEDVSLVLIDGKAVYGNPEMMKKLVDPGTLESLEICGMEKSISFPSENNPQSTFRETQQLLKKALRRWGRTLAPLAECGN